MKKGTKIIWVIVGILAIIGIAIAIWLLAKPKKQTETQPKINEDGRDAGIMSPEMEDFVRSAISGISEPTTISAVIFGMHEEKVYGMNLEDECLVEIECTNREKLKVGQEVSIDCEKNGIITNIQITKESTERLIPEDLWRYCFNTTDKVSVNIEEFTNQSLIVAITDTNDVPYPYNEYVIRQQMMEVPQNAGMTNSTAGCRIEEVEKISAINSKDTIENLATSEQGTVRKKLDWTSLYGTLEPGTYNMSIDGLTINFVVDNNGKVIKSKVTAQRPEIKTKVLRLSEK